MPSKKHDDETSAATNTPETLSGVKPKAATIERTDAEWRSLLTPAQYHVLREHGTERAFSQPHEAHDEPLSQVRVTLRRRSVRGLREPLFSSEQKYDSGSGWPSFFAPIDASAVETDRDTSHGMSRIEVHCARCRGHLGHSLQRRSGTHRPPVLHQFVVPEVDLWRGRAQAPRVWLLLPIQPKNLAATAAADRAGRTVHHA